MQNHSVVRMTEIELRRYREMREQCNQQLAEVLKALYVVAATLHAVNHIVWGQVNSPFELCDIQSCVNARTVLRKYESIASFLTPVSALAPTGGLRDVEYSDDNV